METKYVTMATSQKAKYSPFSTFEGLLLQNCPVKLFIFKFFCPINITNICAIFFKKNLLVKFRDMSFFMNLR